MIVSSIKLGTHTTRSSRPSTCLSASICSTQAEDWCLDRLHEVAARKWQTRLINQKYNVAINSRQGAMKSIVKTPSSTVDETLAVRRKGTPQCFVLCKACLPPSNFITTPTSKAGLIRTGFWVHCLSTHIYCFRTILHNRLKDVLHVGQPHHGILANTYWYFNTSASL